MKATLIPDELTHIELSTAIKLFRNVLSAFTGRSPSNAVVACLVAKSALETNWWKSMHCWNFGNVKAGSKYEGKYCAFRCNEVLEGRVEWFDPPHPQCNFRAWPSAEEGVRGYLGALANSFPRSWATVSTLGDPHVFVRTMKSEKYFTADEGPYERAVVSIWQNIMKALDNGTHEVPDDEIDTRPDGLLRALVVRDYIHDEERHAARDAMESFGAD